MALRLPSAVPRGAASSWSLPPIRDTGTFGHDEHYTDIWYDSDSH